MGAGSRMDAKDVAEYLKQHPKFFEDYADVLAEIFVPHPHGGHAIPIAERQILTLRERTADLEARGTGVFGYPSGRYRAVAMLASSASRTR